MLEHTCKHASCALSLNRPILIAARCARVAQELLSSHISQPFAYYLCVPLLRTILAPNYAVPADMARSGAFAPVVALALAMACGLAAAQSVYEGNRGCGGPHRRQTQRRRHLLVSGDTKKSRFFVPRSIGKHHESRLKPPATAAAADPLAGGAAPASAAALGRSVTVLCPHCAPCALPAAGPEAFINSFDKVGNLLQLPGANISLVSAGQVYGINVAGMSAALVSAAPLESAGLLHPAQRVPALQPGLQGLADCPRKRGAEVREGPTCPCLPSLKARPAPPLAIQINLAPCTILEPHTHPHPEFAFTIYGASRCSNCASPRLPQQHAPLYRLLQIGGAPPACPPAHAPCIPCPLPPPPQARSPTPPPITTSPCTTSPPTPGRPPPAALPCSPQVRSRVPGRRSCAAPVPLGRGTP